MNKEIFETIYFAALSCSCDLAKAEGAYGSYEGSPVSKGILQFDMWGVEPSARWDWTELRARISEHGVRNSLLVALLCAFMLEHKPVSICGYLAQLQQAEAQDNQQQRGASSTGAPSADGTNVQAFAGGLHGSFCGVQGAGPGL